MPLHLLTKTNLSLEIRFYYPEPPSPHTMLGNHLGFHLTQCNIEWGGGKGGLLALVKNGGHIWLNKCIEFQQF